MKKKLLCALLVICMALPLFSGSAWAAKDYSPYIVEVEISAGDTVSDICDSYSIDYYAVKDAILIANGFATEDAISAVHPGQKIFIPRSRADAEAIINLHDAVVSAVIPASYVIRHTVQKDETLTAICTAHRLDFDTCKSAIKSINNWKSDSKLNGIYNGQEIYLPASDAAATAITAAVEKAVDANINVSIASADELQYYLISYTMAAGDTVKNVCDALGVKYSPEVAAMFQTINNVGNISMVQAGRDYLFPSLSAENAEYAVYKHKITDGDTVGDLCTAYGVNYNKVTAILQGLNPKLSMTSIPRDGSILLVAPSNADASQPIITWKNIAEASPAPTIAAVPATAAPVAAAQTVPVPFNPAAAAGTTVDSAAAAAAAAGNSTLANGTLAAAPVNIPAGDTLQYYLIAHKMAAGENVKAVCDSLNIKYSPEVELLLKTINGITDLSKVQAGATYLFPAQKADNALYAVYSHNVAAGETVGKLCTRYGTDYDNVSTILQGLNPVMSMTAIQAGRNILLVTPYNPAAAVK